LQKWKEIVRKVLEAVHETLGDVPVYVFGSVVNGSYTALSDVDVAITLNKVSEKADDRVEIILKIFDKIEDICPWIDCPLEIHLLTPMKKEILERGEAKFVEIETILREE